MTDKWVSSHIELIITDILSSLRSILKEKMAGLYLTGSLVYGDFDEGVSDIDHVSTLPETRRFIREVAALIVERHEPGN
jgi:hypothetical protein